MRYTMHRRLNVLKKASKITIKGPMIKGLLRYMNSYKFIVNVDKSGTSRGESRLIFLLILNDIHIYKNNILS